MTRSGSGCSRSIWRAWMMICRLMSWSRGRSRSTRRGGRARTAPAWGPGWRWIRSWSSPDPDQTLADGAIGPWNGGASRDYFSRLIEALGATLGFSMDTPWSQLARRGPGRLAARLRRARARAVQHRPGPGTVLRRHVRGCDPVHRAAARRGGIRLQPRAVRGLHARGGVPVLRGNPAQAHRPVRDRGRAADRRAVRPAHQRTGYRPAGPGADRDRRPDRGAHPGRDQHPADVPSRHRPGLPEPGPGRPHSGRRGGAADPAGHPDRLGAGGRAVCAG